MQSHHYIHILGGEGRPDWNGLRQSGLCADALHAGILVSESAAPRGNGWGPRGCLPHERMPKLWQTFGENSNWWRTHSEFFHIGAGAEAFLDVFGTKPWSMDIYIYIYICTNIYLCIYLYLCIYISIYLSVHTLISSISRSISISTYLYVHLYKYV